MAQLASEIPGVMKGFNEVHHAATADGALSTKEKELIALGIAVAVRCSLQAGATKEEIMEALGVAIMMSGGPGVTYSKAMEVLEGLTQ